MQYFIVIFGETQGGNRELLYFLLALSDYYTMRDHI